MDYQPLPQEASRVLYRILTLSEQKDKNRFAKIYTLFSHFACAFGRTFFAYYSMALSKRSTFTLSFRHYLRPKDLKV